MVPVFSQPELCRMVGLIAPAMIVAVYRAPTHVIRSASTRFPEVHSSGFPSLLPLLHFYSVRDLLHDLSKW
jgi:hypothetical protein